MILHMLSTFFCKSHIRNRLLQWIFSSSFRSHHTFGAAVRFSTPTFFSQAIPFHSICEHLRSLKELVPLKAAVWLSACRPRPGATWKIIGWFASNDEYRSSALGSSLVSYIFQYLRSFCLRLGDLIGPQRIWRWTAVCAFISLQTFWIGKHVFDPAVSKSDFLREYQPFHSVGFLVLDPIVDIFVFCVPSGMGSPV